MANSKATARGLYCTSPTLCYLGNGPRPDGTYYSISIFSKQEGRRYCYATGESIPCTVGVCSSAAKVKAIPSMIRDPFASRPKWSRGWPQWTNLMRIGPDPSPSLSGLGFKPNLSCYNGDSRPTGRGESIRLSLFAGKC